eukprot:238995_1
MSLRILLIFTAIMMHQSYGCNMATILSSGVSIPVYAVGVCLIAEDDGTPFATEVVCEDTATTTLNGYEDSSTCTGTPDDTYDLSDVATGGCVDTEGECNYAVVTAYSATDCTNDGDYVQIAIVTDECFGDEDNSAQYLCSGGSLTAYLYDGDDCTGSWTDSNTVYEDG